MRRMILSENVFDEKIFLFFALLGNSIPHLVLLSGRRRTVPNEKGREGLYLWRKDRTCENDSLTKAVELEKEAVFGRLEEPLIVAPHLEARRGNSHHGKMPAVIFSGKVSDPFSGGTALEVAHLRSGGLALQNRFVLAS